MWHMTTTKDTIGLTLGWYSWRMLTQSVETVFLTTRRCIVLKGRAVKFEVPLADVINLDLDQMGVFDRTSCPTLPKFLSIFPGVAVKYRSGAKTKGKVLECVSPTVAAALEHHFKRVLVTLIPPAPDKPSEAAPASPVRAR